MIKKGDKIESQNDIKSFCDFSLITIIKTLNDLQAEGIIERKVGKGSYLQNAPWFTSHLRIGFFYNRDVVGGGIFHNNFLILKFIIRIKKYTMHHNNKYSDEQLMLEDLHYINKSRLEKEKKMIMDIIKVIRNLRAENNVPPHKTIGLQIYAKNKNAEVIEQMLLVIG